MTVVQIVELATQVVNSVGFPIACVVAMFWMFNKEREAHAAESAQWCEVVDRNTEALTELSRKLRLDYET